MGRRSATHFSEAHFLLILHARCSARPPSSSSSPVLSNLRDRSHVGSPSLPPTIPCRKNNPRPRTERCTSGSAQPCRHELECIQRQKLFGEEHRTMRFVRVTPLSISPGRNP